MLSRSDVLNNKRGALMSLAMSTFAANMMHTLVSNVDQIMISRYSQAAVAAVGNANQITWVITLLFSVFSTASVILITQYKGANNKEHEDEVYALSIAANTLLGLIVGAVCIIFGRQIFALMNVTDPEIAELAYQYIAIVGGAVVFPSLMITYGALFRSNAMMRENMIITIAVNLLNVVGNWLLIYGVGIFPELGVRGVAISTVFSRVLGLIATIIIFRRKVGGIRWSALRRFPVRQFWKLVRIGVPAAGESFSYDTAQLVIMGFVNTMGIVAVNTKIYVGMISMLTYMFTASLGDATQVFEGYLLGAKRHDDAYKRVMKTLLVGVICSVAATVLVYFFSDPILRLFIGNDAEALLLRDDILRLGKTIFLIEIGLEFGRAFNLTLVKALQTAGDIKFPTFMCMVSSWTLSVLGGYIMGVQLGWGLVGIWLGIMLDECIRGIILLIRWKAGGWRKRDVISE
ncbi:MAG: MATE family efflux transporter [Ruminococcaceae bacterium]|nr:MATE family efflux transporter [Oscillospiraceae bacterium]